jgi:hypothetical protein
MKNHLPSFFPSSKKVIGKIIGKIIGKNMGNSFTTTPCIRALIIIINHHYTLPSVYYNLSSNVKHGCHLGIAKTEVFS